MEIKFNAKDFLEVLNKIKHIARFDKACPILSNGIFETTEDGLKITVSSLLNRAEINAEVVVIEPGKCLIEIDKLTAIISTFTGETFIEEKDNVIWIKSGKTKCRLDKNLLEDYPENLFGFSNSECTFKISSDALIEGIKKTEKFTAKAENSMLSGINLKIDNNMAKFAATDGNKLAYILKCSRSSDVFCDIIIPYDSAMNMLPLFSADTDIEVFVEKGICKFLFHNAEGNVIFSTRLLEGQYPKFEQLIPKESQINFELNKDELKKALERISVVESKDDKCIVLLSVKGSLLTVEAKDYKCNDILTLSEKSGDDISFALNRIFLDTVLNVLSTDNIRFCMNTPLSAVLFPDMEHKYMIMPMTIK